MHAKPGPRKVWRCGGRSQKIETSAKIFDYGPCILHSSLGKALKILPVLKRAFFALVPNFVTLIVTSLSRYVGHRMSARLAILVRTSCSLKLQICKATSTPHGLINASTCNMASFGSLFWHGYFSMNSETSHEFEQL